MLLHLGYERRYVNEVIHIPGNLAWWRNTGRADGYWIYNRKKKATTDTKDFFLAEGSLTWWAIGASLIASNISAEQFIGMSGEGFFLGVAVAAYEWIAAVVMVRFFSLSFLTCCRKHQIIKNFCWQNIHIYIYIM